MKKSTNPEKLGVRTQDREGTDQIWFERVKSENNIGQFSFKIEKIPKINELAYAEGTEQIDEKSETKRYQPSLSGTDKEVMVQPQLETLTCMVPLLSSKSSGFCFESAMEFRSLSTQIWKINGGESETCLCVFGVDTHQKNRILMGV